MENLTPGHHADHALAALLAAHPNDEEHITWEENTADLLADLMHFTDVQEFSFTDALEQALDHYSREVEQ